TARPPAGPPRQEEDDWWGEPQDTVGHPTGAPAATDGYGASGPADGHGYEYARAEPSGPGADHAESGAGRGSRGGGHEDDDIWGDPTQGRTGGRDGGR
ncbi:hypothetical protein SAM9427_28020, partial [Streptomyces sp. ETH9427]